MYLWIRTFRWNTLPQFSGWLVVVFLRNCGINGWDCTVSQPRRPQTEYQTIGFDKLRWSRRHLYTSVRRNLARNSVASQTNCAIKHSFLSHEIAWHQSNVELNSTSFSTVQGAICSSNLHVIFTMFYASFFLSFCLLISAFELRILQIFWNMNLKQTITIKNNNSDNKGTISGFGV
jgi:hypothetical protein